MADVKLIRSDLPKEKKSATLECVDLLYRRHIKGGPEKKTLNQKREVFAKQLKMSLDDSFGKHWHVLIGVKIGFACKKKNQTMAVFKAEESMVVIWQSPGIEEPEPKMPEEKKEEEEKATEKAEEKKKEPVKVLEPATFEEGSEAEKVAETLKRELEKQSSDEDVQVAANSLRRVLTEEFGTIWHVAVGHDFVLEAAEDRRNSILLTKGKTRVTCFQHEQKVGGVVIQWGKIFASLPYLLFTIFCFAYMTLNSVCNEENPDPTSKGIRMRLRNRFCEEDWQGSLSYVAGAALVTLFVGKKFKKAQSSAKVKAKKLA